jgi:transposase
MLSTPRTRRKRSPRDPFRAPLWDDQHPEFQRLDLLLPVDHHARWLSSVVAHLDLTTFRLSYLGYGSLAYPVERLLPFVLFMYSKGTLSPADWWLASLYDDQSKWLLRGLQPSRSLLYRFRDRVEPFLDDWHAQIIAWAVFEKLTTAECGSLDGTLIAALASRHRLLSCRRVDQRLLLLRLLVWFDDHPFKCDLATYLDDLAAWLLNSAEGRPLPLGSAKPPCAAALDNLVDLLGPVLQGQVSLPARMPAWVPATAAGRKRVLKRYVRAQERLAQRLTPYQQKKKLSKKDKEAIKRLKVSLTDAEAALGWDKMGTYRPLYNLLLVQATDAPLTLAWDVLGCNNDQGLIQVMMEKMKKQVNHYLKELLVDGGFLNVSDVVWCEKEQIVIYAPPTKAEAVNAEVAKAMAAKVEVAKAMAAKAEAVRVEAARAEAVRAEAAKAEAVGAEVVVEEAVGAEAVMEGVVRAEVARAEAVKVEAVRAEVVRTEPAKAEVVRAEAVRAEAAKEKVEKLPKSAFRYDSADQAYYCPQGKRLEPVSRTTEKRKSGMELPVISYRAAGADCQACPQRAGCTSNAKKGRVVKRYEGEEALERLEQRMQEPAAQRIYKLRCQTVELGNADLKEHRGLRVFRSFGRKRARAQAGLVILASNGLKIMNALQRRQRAEHHPPAQEKRSA